MTPRGASLCRAPRRSGGAGSLLRSRAGGERVGGGDRAGRPRGAGVNVLHLLYHLSNMRYDMVCRGPAEHTRPPSRRATSLDGKHSMLAERLRPLPTTASDSLLIPPSLRNSLTLPLRRESVQSRLSRLCRPPAHACGCGRTRATRTRHTDHQRQRLQSASLQSSTAPHPHSSPPHYTAYDYLPKSGCALRQRGRCSRGQRPLPHTGGRSSQRG